ncbi:hypothetical protein [Methylococcus capsulatus]|uniref:hypothetical protein n=1 Tax=Methylococcus capsulatus TaxID=414 RepID=UPI001C52CAB4|nr:hypothetical protein [Methylococcus capsulatus]QXP87541.1 hypothetical protein KW112_14490 [Methylococcus capsulatus]QXP92719.1 hypothetical protein KW113_10020 [Methylococcus capsulatus]UQN12552.1 hypothetical protein M3M30_01470 [Methylococcus capsulatus]
MRILLLEADAMIGKSVQLGPKREGHAVDGVRDGVAAALARFVARLRASAVR